MKTLQCEMDEFEATELLISHAERIKESVVNSQNWGIPVDLDVIQDSADSINSLIYGLTLLQSVDEYAGEDDPAEWTEDDETEEETAD